MSSLVYTDRVSASLDVHNLYTERSRGGHRFHLDLAHLGFARRAVCSPSGAEVDTGRISTSLISASFTERSRGDGCSQNLIQIHHARLHVYPTLLRRHILCRKHKKSQSENTSTHVRKWSKAYSKETTRETCLC